MRLLDYSAGIGHHTQAVHLSQVRHESFESLFWVSAVKHKIPTAAQLCYQAATTRYQVVHHQYVRTVTVESRITICDNLYCLTHCDLPLQH